MKKSSLIRAFLSIVIVALGGVLLLKNLEIINISWDIFWGTVWAAGFVLSGLVNIFNYRNKTAWIWGLLLVAIGILIGLNSYGIVDVSIWKVFWPVVLIAAGLAMMFNTSLRVLSVLKSWIKTAQVMRKLLVFGAKKTL